MKTKYIYLKTAAAFLLGGTLLISSCEKTPLDNVKLIIDFSVVKTIIGVSLVDASTGQNIETGNPNVVIEGHDKAKVMDISGTEDLKMTNGRASMALKSGVLPTEADAIEFTVIGQAEGYLSASQSVYISEHGGYSVVLRLVSIENPPTGVAGTTNNSLTTDANGNTTSDITITTPDVTTTGTAAAVVIPDGTRITGANGEPLVGTINSTIVYFANQDDEAMQSFPGGFSNTVTLNDGTESSVTFITAGFIAINMTDGGGNEAAFFDPPIEVYMEIPSETIDDQGNPIAIGTEIPIWSYEDETGEWQQEPGMAVVQGTTKNGNFHTSFPISHLSWWNLDWFVNNCTTGATVNIISQGCGTNSVYLELRRTNGDYLASSYRWLNAGDNPFTFYYVPLNTAAVLYIKPDYFSEPIATIQINDLCIGTYSATISSPGNSIPVHGLFVGLCENDPDFELRPSGYLWYRKASDFWWNSAYVWNGEITLCLAQNTMYVFGTVFSGQWYQYEYLITQPEYLYEMILPQEFCP